MGQDLIVTILSVIGVGVVASLVTLAVAKKSLVWGLVLSPFTVILSIGTGLIVGLQLMLFEGAELVYLIVGATAPVALMVGVFVSLHTQRIIQRAHERLEEERREREVEQGRRELITWLSHDLRTPLAGIQAMGEALEDGIAPHPEAYYTQIISEAKRTSSMVEDLMDLARLQSGTTVLVQEHIDVRDLVSDGISHLQGLASTRDLIFVLDMSKVTDIQHMECVGDVRLLSRALQNILGNALHYSHPHNEIVVELYRSNQSAVINVIDACGGISEETQHRMFEVGWRGNSARTPHTYTGSGLGLPIVKTIIESHGGSVAVERCTGCCKVILQLPLKKDET